MTALAARLLYLLAAALGRLPWAVSNGIGGLADVDPSIGTRVLNAAVERIASRDPTQYQWTYKRYTLRPPDSGETNPYRDLERH